MFRAIDVLAALVGTGFLAGCPATTSTGTGECDVDTQCGGEVCARDHLCRAASDVREVTVRWTIAGAPASADTCAGKDLYVEFHGLDLQQTLAFTPVPCPAGSFHVDKLPLDFVDAEVGPTGRGPSAISPIDATNAVTVDLRL